VAQAHFALQPHHVARMEDVADQAESLAHEQAAAAAGHDARGVLAAMLQQRQTVIEHLVDGPVADNADDSAHKRCSSPYRPCGRRVR